MHAPNHHSVPGNSARLRWAVALFGGVCSVLGLLVLIAWHLHLLALIQLRPTLAPMQYNTALCFILAGTALGAWAWGRVPQALPILGGLVAAIAGLTLSEYLFHADLRIDQSLFHSYITTETSHIGRMSPVSSFCLALAGLALLFLGLRGAPRWRPLAVGSLASVIVSISVVALLGYAFRLPGTYGWGQLTRMAMHTASGVGLLGAGLFIIAWHIGYHPGERTPRWLPVALALGVLTGSLVLYFALASMQDQVILQTVKAGAESAKSQISVRMEARIHSFVRMARRWELSGDASQAVWEADAADSVHDSLDLQAIEWLDTAHRVRWIVPRVRNETDPNAGFTHEEHSNAAVERAEREHQPVITGIVTLFNGELGFIIYVPIVVNGQSHGVLAAIFAAQSCLNRYVPPAVAAGEAIRISESGRIFYGRDAGVPSTREDWVTQERIELHGTTWDLRMWPTPALASRLDSPLPEVVLCAGAIGSLLLAAVCFYAQRSSRQAAATARANAALQTALDEVKTLEGLLPICACCKRVRDDTGYWSQIDTYLRRHTDASFTHGYCPECAAKAYQEFGLDVPDSVQADLEARNFE